MQVEPVAEAVVMEVEDQVTATGTPPLVDKDLVAQLVGDAQRLGLSVEGEGGLLAQLTKLVLESALEGEMTAHLGYDKHERVEGSDNARNGTRSKTVLTKAGPVEIAVPRDRAGSFEPVVVAKRQRRLGAIEDVVLSLSARGPMATSRRIWPMFMALRCRRPRSRRSPTRSWTRWASGRTDHWTRCIRWCSSTRFM